MIDIVTPTVRADFIPMVDKCLKRQTHQDYQWLIGTPEHLYPGVAVKVVDNEKARVFVEPPKREDDYYGLNKCWNKLFSKTEGELVVSIVDGIWFPPDTLERLWTHYEANPKALIGTIGHQYDQVENGKPENQVWSDPRARTDYGSFYEINPIDMELCLASIPRQAILDVGGVDEEYDKYAAMSEKEMCLRMDKAGYKFYLDQSLEYRAVKHPRLTEDWDTHYFAGQDTFAKHVHDINTSGRLKLPYLDEYNRAKVTNPNKESATH